PVQATDPSGLQGDGTYGFDADGKGGKFKAELNHKRHRMYLEKKGKIPFAFINDRPDVKLVKKPLPGPPLLCGVNAGQDTLKQYNFIQFERVRVYSKLKNTDDWFRFEPKTVPTYTSSTTDWKVPINNTWIIDAKKHSVFYPGQLFTPPPQDKV